MISRFDGQYDWLSNFYASPVVMNGLTYPTVENAFQAAKAPPERRTQYTLCTPGQAKRWGRSEQLPPDWETIKMELMLQLLKFKFAYGTPLAAALITTSDEELIEGNNWGDDYWGRCSCFGKNHLGRLLMHVRKELHEHVPAVENAC